MWRTSARQVRPSPGGGVAATGFDRRSLSGVIGGAATSDVEAAARVEDLFRSIVVVRGGSPMPPRDLIPLKMPAAPGTA